MGRGLFYVCAVSLAGALCAAPGWAGPLLLMPQESESYWMFVSPSFPRAPLEVEGAPLWITPVKLVSLKTQTGLRRSPANARRSRMAAEQMRLHWVNPMGKLSYPGPARLPLYLENSTQEL